MPSVSGKSIGEESVSHPEDIYVKVLLSTRTHPYAQWPYYTRENYKSKPEGNSF